MNAIRDKIIAGLAFIATALSYCLYDSTNKQFMTEEDFNRAESAELSLILDGIILLEMSGHLI
jgi:hypothetical protein